MAAWSITAASAGLSGTTAARSAFEAACGKAGVVLAAGARGAEGTASAGWLELTGGVATT